MWLDRLAGNPASASGSSTPQSVGRSFSPLPRRTSSALSPYVTSQRPGLTPRGSALSLVSNDSSISLLSSSRRPNGTGPRQTSTAGVPTQDSLQTLESLLRATTGEDDPDDDQSGSVISEADIAFEADFAGLSLREFAHSRADPTSTSKVRRQTTREEQNTDKAKYEDLHKSITACDDVLSSVETNLTSFRNDLASVSDDIESLQARSTALNRRLENRQEVAKALNPMVEELSVSPEIISKISEGQIDETWAKMLGEVERRTATLKKKPPGSQQSKAAGDLEPLLEKLTQKAIERIRDFLVAQIKSLRSPNINAQIIQQQNFIRFKDLFTFLHSHHAQLADEISLAYMNTMRWYYLNQFSRYERALSKIKLHALDKTDVIGHEDTTRVAAVLSTSRNAGPPHDAFNLGRRIDLLKSGSQAALPSYLAEDDQSTHYLEVPFRNFNLALVDNATAEYTFMATFFSPALSLQQISRNFNYVFEPTYELGQTLTKSLVGDTFDALGLLLSIRINQHLAFELQRRRVPAVDGYVNATNMLLWPRLQVIMDRHCESVRAQTNAVPAPGKAVGAGGGDSAAAARTASAAPHMLTQRFGQLLQGLLALSTDAGGDDEPVVASLRRLRSELEAFLARQSRAYGADDRRSERFLYNNYSLILTIIGDAEGKLAAENQEHFEALKQAHQEPA